MREVTIPMVTRIEGHGRVTIILDDAGRVRESYFSVLDVRGFEKFLEGCAVEDMPKFTPRVCGVCPVAHHLASAKACDDVFGVEPTPMAKKVRELWMCLHQIHSHTIHIFALAGPDLFLPDADRRTRNIFAIIEKEPKLAKKVIALRKFGQEGCRTIAGKAIHPMFAMPGGVSGYFTEEKGKKIKELSEGALDFAVEAVELLKKKTEELMETKPELVESSGLIETNFLSLSQRGTFNAYDGNLRLMDKKGKVVEFKPREYRAHIAEAVLPYSYTKAPHWKGRSLAEGLLRVGPLARLNVNERFGTERADEYLKEYKRDYGTLVQTTFLYHYTRAIELLHFVEKVSLMLDDSDLYSKDRIAEASYEPRAAEGVGVVEAPRGTLIHHYITDNEGLIKDVNLIVATTFNNPCIDTDVKAAAERLISGKGLKAINERLLNQIEMTIRCYDPCLSCSAHSVEGRFPLIVEVLGPEGEKLKELRNF